MMSDLVKDMVSSLSVEERHLEGYHNDRYCATTRRPRVTSLPHLVTQSVIDKAGRIDISFDAIGIPEEEEQGILLTDLPVESFTLPIVTHATSYFLIARLAARRMVANKSG